MIKNRSKGEKREEGDGKHKDYRDGVNKASGEIKRRPLEEDENKHRLLVMAR